jgi:hypothetical protein
MKHKNVGGRRCRLIVVTQGIEENHGQDNVCSSRDSNQVHGFYKSNIKPEPASCVRELDAIQVTRVVSPQASEIGVGAFR